MKTLSLLVIFNSLYKRMRWYDDNTANNVTTVIIYAIGICSIYAIGYRGNYCHEQEAIWCHIHISRGVSLNELTRIDGQQAIVKL